MTSTPGSPLPTRSRTVLLVDDDAAVLETLNDTLRGDYLTRIATAGARVQTLAATPPLPDLILLDVGLPDIDGYEVCRRLKANPETAAIPVIFLSAHDAVDDITRGLAIGAVDYIAKPVLPPILRARVQTHLRLKEAYDLLQNQNLDLERMVRQRTQALEVRTEELLRSQELTIMALGSIAETRDNDTGNHIRRTRAYMQRMCERLADTERFRHQLTPEEWLLAWKAAPLHDIGKVGIPDHILHKPGRLTPEEFEIMKRHTTLGRDALTAADEHAHAGDTFLRIATAIAYSHHERWDSKGYPQAIGGEAIPLVARLMAVADVYDALITQRSYKPAFTHDDTIGIIRDGSGSQFDPEVIACFLELADDFHDIAHRFADAQPVTSERI